MLKLSRIFVFVTKHFDRKHILSWFQHFLHKSAVIRSDSIHNKLHTYTASNHYNAIFSNSVTLQYHSIHKSAFTKQFHASTRDFKRATEFNLAGSNNSTEKLENNLAERFQILSGVLDCSVEDVKKLSDKHRFLYHLRPELLKEKIDLIISYGIPHAVILQNIRVCYKISAKLLDRRLKLLHERSLLNNDNVRFLEGENKDFNQAFEYLYNKKQALEGSADFSEYLQSRLHCTEHEAKSMLSSPPFTKGYTSIKLKKMTDFFLLEAKLRPQFLLQNSFLYTFSVKRLRYRLDIMNEVGISDPFMMKKVWFYSNKKFDSRFKKYLKEEKL